MTPLIGVLIFSRSTRVFTVLMAGYLCTPDQSVSLHPCSNTTKNRGFLQQTFGQGGQGTRGEASKHSPCLQPGLTPNFPQKPKKKFEENTNSGTSCVLDPPDYSRCLTNDDHRLDTQDKLLASRKDKQVFLCPLFLPSLSLLPLPQPLPSVMGTVTVTKAIVEGLVDL